jgi:hypothetical protein
MPRGRSVCLSLLLFLLAGAGARSAETSLSEPELTTYVTAQFGSRFTPAPTVLRKDQPMLVTGDLDGDGQEDAVIIVRTKDPLADELKFSYKVIDPYDQFYGWGDVHDTVRFVAADTEQSRVLLIVHSWRSATPKLKFAVINLPFDTLKIEEITIKKRQRVVINATEQDVMRSYVFWDGKRYRYEPGPME